MIWDKYWIERNGEPVEVETMLEWAAWFETADRVVLQTTIGDLLVSSVFLGIDHNFGRKGPPLLYETMVFEGIEWATLMRREFPRERYTARHATRAEAIAHHERCVEALRAEWDPDYRKERDA